MAVTLSRRWAGLPAVVLALMAGVQALRIHGQDLNSWADGPGFAMFSRLDAIPSRFVRLHLATERGLERVAPFDALAGPVHDLRVLPSRAHGEAVADALLERSWMRTAEGLQPREGRPAESPLVEVRGARVELWSLDLDAGTITPYRKRVVSRGVADG